MSRSLLLQVVVASVVTAVLCVVGQRVLTGESSPAVTGAVAGAVSAVVAVRAWRREKTAPTE